MNADMQLFVFVCALCGMLLLGVAYGAAMYRARQQKKRMQNRSATSRAYMGVSARSKPNSRYDEANMGIPEDGNK